MATSYKQVGKGSTGSSVTELQKLLNQNGYSLAEDGVFGSKTLAAVKDYQSKNGLSVDGIAGNQTWGSLTSKNTNSNGANNTNQGANDKGFSYDTFTYDDYAQSDAEKQAWDWLQTQLNSKPGEYKPTWESQTNSIIDSILNREDFSYDVNSDAIYQQYKEQYASLGKLAMQDTMGQAAAMTGGYGNSYAATAGNQAYQSYLSQLNEVVPELYGMALDRYNQEGENLYKEYALLSDQEDREYDRYQDQYNKWLDETQLGYDVYNTERNFNYNDYINNRNFEYDVYSNNKSYAYDEYRNAIADEQWEKTHELNVNADKRAAEAWDLEKKSYSDSNTSGGLGGLGKETSDETKYLADLEDIQKWSDAILNAESESEVLRYLPNLEQLDPALADSLYEQWLKDHGLYSDKVDTTVNGTSKGNASRGGGGLSGINSRANYVK